MKPLFRFLPLCLSLHVVGLGAVPSLAQREVQLPEGVKAVWDVSKASREFSSTRERISINGLWRWQPSINDGTTLPDQNWGFFKVPGSWPGNSDYMQKDCQAVFAHPAWKGTSLASVTSAWYQRQITIPANWSGRRVCVTADYVNSLATLYIDGKNAGEIRFPAGEADITSFCKPGSSHLLSIRVTAAPLKAVLLSYTDTNAARMIKGAVNRRGLCGDLWLTSSPQSSQIADVKIDTSVQRHEITFSANLKKLVEGRNYKIHAEVKDRNQRVLTATSRNFAVRDVNDGKLRFSHSWDNPRLWDTHTPNNIYTASLTLTEVDGKVVDTSIAQQFGFREFWIKGKDFCLNGTPIHLSALPLDNAQVGAHWASYAAAKESMERLQSFGINFVYTHNYDCEPGSYLSFKEILRAADDCGMLVAISQPHFSNYEWQAPDADKSNSYAAHAEFFVRESQDHPSVIAYAMSHNATSYDEAKNPNKMDGLPVNRDSWSMGNVLKAQRAEAIVSRLDPSRIVYHHSSGNLGTMYTENFYVNFAPIQELSDWFGHWATNGVKPLFLCEYGVPFSWDWTMYRGWYKGKREWGSARVPWELCIAEWNAQFYGDRAYKISEPERRDLRWEAQQFKTRDGWNRWDYPVQVGSSAFEETSPIFASYITDNWRAYRTWGVSAISPWEYEAYWKLNPKLDSSRKLLPVDWEHLQKPGYSADYIDQRYNVMNMSYDRSDWIPSEAAKAVIRNNRPILAYIAGKRTKFTSKDHIFHPLETIEKQLVIINNSRLPIRCNYTWSCDSTKANGQTKVGTGEQVKIPFNLKLADNTTLGRHRITAKFQFGTGESQEDSFDIDVVTKPQSVSVTSKIGLYDPKGETRKSLDLLGVRYQELNAVSNMSGVDILLIGKGALTLGGAAPDISRVRNGLKVVVFEQTSEVLEQRLGFRVTEYGLRQAFPRVSNHPLLKDLDVSTLRDWRGEATLLPSVMPYTLKPMYGPMVKWCGMEVPHVWRAGNQGNVASVLIEKPGSSDFLPIIDGGYSLQYSPLMLHREGNGMMLFCQMDISGRTEEEPAAQRLLTNILNYAGQWKASPKVAATFIGSDAAKTHLQSAGFEFSPMTEPKTKGDVLVVSSSSTPLPDARFLRNWRSKGGQILALGMNAEELKFLTAGEVLANNGEHIASYFESGNAGTWLEGIASADVHNRTASTIPLITGGAELIGDGVLAHKQGAFTMCQLTPWKFDPKLLGERRTFRKSTYLLSRLASNLGITSRSPIGENFGRPTDAGKDRRWLNGLYLDIPEEWDDPYRFFPW